MKTAIYIFILLAIALIVFNITKLDFNNLFEGDSLVASISILASACVILLMLILRTSHRIKKKKSDEEENTVRRRGRSCWVKCSVVTPIDRTGEEHIIPSWILSKHVLSQITA